MTTDRATDVLAVVGVSSPFWLHTLEQTSQVAALLLPIVGLIWLVARVWRWAGQDSDEE